MQEWLPRAERSLAHYCAYKNLHRRELLLTLLCAARQSRDLGTSDVDVDSQAAGWSSDF